MLNDLAHWNLNLWQSLRSLWAGLKATARHARKASRQPAPLGIQHPDYFRQAAQGAVTIQYPTQHLPVPDVGRYRLAVEIEDCIGCDKCSRICPVDCITIEKVRSPDALGLTSDGSKKNFWFPTFDIDMAKCMFCGLCTVVCPTECIIMTKSYDYSTSDRDRFLHHFGNIGPSQAQHLQREWEAHEASKAAAKAAALAAAKAAKPASDAPVPPQP